MISPYLRDSGTFMGLFTFYPVLLAALPTLLLAFLVMYIVEHMHGEQDERSPLLGVVLLMLMTLALQIVFFGMAMLAGALTESAEGGARTAVAFIFGGGLAGFFPTVLYAIRVRGPGSRRLLQQTLGINAVAFGVAFAIGITTVMVMLFNESRSLSFPFCFAMVYFGASMATMLGLSREASA